MPRGLAVPRTHQTQQPLPPTADQASSETETCFSPATMHAAEGREVGVPPACGGEPGNPASAWRRCAPPVLLASPLGKSDLGDDLRLFAGVFLGAHRAGFMQRLQVLQPLTNGRLRWRRRRCPIPAPAAAGCWAAARRTTAMTCWRTTGKERMSTLPLIGRLLALYICRISISGPACPLRS